MLHKEFFEGLSDGDEYLSLLIKRDDYAKISQELRDKIVVNTVRQKNNLFVADPVHKELSRTSREASKQLRNYEFKINHK